MISLWVIGGLNVIQYWALKSMGDHLAYLLLAFLSQNIAIIGNYDTVLVHINKNPSLEQTSARNAVNKRP